MVSALMSELKLRPLTGCGKSRFVILRPGFGRRISIPSAWRHWASRFFVRLRRTQNDGKVTFSAASTTQIQTDAAPKDAARFCVSGRVAVTLLIPMSLPAKTGTILDRIVEARLAAIQHGKKRIPEPALRAVARKNEKPRDFAAAISKPGINIIAELKKASPSQGVIREEFEPGSLAKSVQAGGAAALSVLTEEEFFQGSIGYLRTARKATALPALRKDFIVDPWQVWETLAGDGDAFLLIVAILTDAQLRSLIALGRELGLPALVEAHTRAELRRAVDCGAQIVGVNNRDLRTFEVRVETSLELAEEIPEECIAVSESGIHSAGDLQRLRDAGFDAFLIGERLMKSADPGVALRELTGARDAQPAGPA